MLVWRGDRLSRLGRLLDELGVAKRMPSGFEVAWVSVVLAGVVIVASQQCQLGATLASN